MEAQPFVLFFIFKPIFVSPLEEPNRVCLGIFVHLCETANECAEGRVQQGREPERKEEKREFGFCEAVHGFLPFPDSFTVGSC